MSNEGAPTQLTPEIRLLRCLGKGGMGSVWVAEHTRLGNDVVVKLLDGARVTDDTSRARFTREAEAAKQVTNEHVVRIFDFGVSDDGTPFIVMERLVGHDLGFEIRRSGTVAPELVAHVLDQVATALTAVHERKIIHRDIKPGNIFLCTRDAEGESLPLVKVLDFGIAKVTVTDEATLTATGEILGTPLYMSPEQFESSGSVDHRTDVWSLGVVAFRALTGKPPFRGDTVGQIVASVLTHPMPVPTRVRPQLPRGVDEWFATACARNADERFASARDLADAFAKAILTEPLAHGVAPSATPTVPPPTGSQGSIVALGSTVQNATIEAHEERKRKRTGLYAALAATALLAVLFAKGWRTGPRSAQPAASDGHARAGAGATLAAKFVAVGRHHSCVIMPDGTLRCWGANNVGQLGVGDDAPRLVPTPVPGISNVVFVALGLLHTCAVTDSGSTYCWGASTRGQVGDGAMQARSSPVLVKGLGPARKVQCGKEHSCAEMRNGTALCWGSNVVGELGDGTHTDRAVPTPVQGVAGIRKLSVGGGQHTCAALGTGAVVCWGSNTRGQLGARAAGESTTPMPVMGLPPVSKVFVGLEHSCALMADATAQCWGANDFGQLGDGTTIQRDTPAPVAGLTSVESLGSGWRTTCAALSNGVVECWGANDHGQLGLGKLGGFEPRPVAVPDLRHVGAETAMKGEHACTLAADGSLRCWGWNDEGQLGDGTKDDRATPVLTKL